MNRGIGATGKGGNGEARSRSSTLRLALVIWISGLPLFVLVLGVLSLPAGRSPGIGPVVAAAGALLLSLGFSFCAARAYAGRAEGQLAAEIRRGQVERQLRERAEAQTAAAENAERSKDLFLAMVSHELRGPLTAVIGWLEIGRSHADEPATLRRAVDIALRNAWRQARIMDDLLDVSRIVSGRFSLERRPVELSRVVREAAEAVRPAASQRRIELRCQVQEPVFVEGDPGRLLQAIDNLLVNALKFNQPGGWVSVVLERSAEQARLSVADNGAGIDPAALPHVFERFWQGDAVTMLLGRGLGLGLPLVRHIVELHGGRVAAESGGRGKGACFTVYLPMIASAGSSIALGDRPGAPEDAPRLHGLGVVALDRDDDTLEWLQYLLALHGAATWKARSVGEALALVAHRRADVMVSGVAAHDGRDEVVRALRAGASQRRVAAVAFSSRPTEEECRGALAAGYDGFVARPCDPQAMVRAVRLAAQRTA